MIKISGFGTVNYSYLHDAQEGERPKFSCKVHLKVDPVRPGRKWEENIALTLAKEDSRFIIEKEDVIFRIISNVSSLRTLEDLRKMQEGAQEEFSQKILQYRNKLEDLKLLQKLIKKEEKK